MAKKTAQPGAPQPKKPKQKKIRLVDLLVGRGYFADRGEALRAVLAHEVRANDVYPTSAAVLVNPDADVFVRNRRAYVSRGGHKLQGAIDAFAQDVRGARCIDIGSSTGGFTDCLLQAGAAEVACVDVNYGQLAWKLREDERVRVFERTNIKTASRRAWRAVRYRRGRFVVHWLGRIGRRIRCTVRAWHGVLAAREAPVRKRPRRNRPRHRAR